MAFAKLYVEYRANKERFVPAYECIGEMSIKNINRDVFMSYKCPTRLTDLFLENPNMLERQLIVGKSGAKYFGYRFRIGVKESDIVDEKLRKFYGELSTV